MYDWRTLPVLVTKVFGYKNASNELRTLILAVPLTYMKRQSALYLPRRRLFILEGLPCNHILALGSELRIPPSFFAGHWNDPASPTFNHRNPFQECLPPHFRIRYATSNGVRVDDQVEPDNALVTLHSFNTNVCRFFHEFRPRGLTYDEVWRYHVLSCKARLQIDVRRSHAALHLRQRCILKYK